LGENTQWQLDESSNADLEYWYVRNEMFEVSRRHPPYEITKDGTFKLEIECEDKGEGYTMKKKTIIYDFKILDYYYNKFDYETPFIKRFEAAKELNSIKTHFFDLLNYVLKMSLNPSKYKFFSKLIYEIKDTILFTKDLSKENQKKIKQQFQELLNNLSHTLVRFKSKAIWDNDDYHPFFDLLRVADIFGLKSNDVFQFLDAIPHLRDTSKSFAIYKLLKLKDLNETHVNSILKRIGELPKENQKFANSEFLARFPNVKDRIKLR